MEKKMKYIVYTGALADEIYLFPYWIQHNSFAFTMNFLPEDILSAGFIEKSCDGNLKCFGQSVSLGVKSNPEVDTRLLNKLLCG